MRGIFAKDFGRTLLYTAFDHVITRGVKIVAAL